MESLLKKYQGKFSLIKTLNLLLSFFILQQVLAQNEVVIDTTISGIEDMKEPPLEESEVENLFLKKWMPGAGMDSVILRHLPDSVVKKIKEDEDYLYGSKNKAKSGNNRSYPEQGGNRATSRERRDDSGDVIVARKDGLQIGLWVVIIAGFVVFLMLWLSNSLFRKKTTFFPNNETEEISEDIFAINYQKEIDKAAAAGNYRLAIRLMFLRVLKNMSERNIIRYKQDSTNLDYLMQLHASSYYTDFFRMARNYEYSWYGHFEVKEDVYKIIRSDFDNFDRKIR